MSEPKIKVYGQIVVSPCLQELKKGGRIASKEYEQQPSKWVNGKLKPLFEGFIYGSADASAKFDAYWRGNGKGPQVEGAVMGSSLSPDGNNPITKNGLLEIPNMKGYGFIRECKSLTCNEKWAMYTEFLCDKFAEMSEMSEEKNNVALIVTHHNRMRDTDLSQGLLPFTSKKIEIEGRKKELAYANNFCLKIEIDPHAEDDKIVTFKVFFPGFPDKGDFEQKAYTSENVEGISINSLSGEQGSGSSYPSQEGGGDDYSYQTDASKIKMDVIRAGIISGLKNFTGIKKLITIYFLRHGNSLHNKPVEISDYGIEQKRLDSSLTPLGMYQATILAAEFSEANAFLNSNIVLCCSFLQRTQLTGLLLLEAAGVPLDEKMKKGLQEMKDQAITRYSESGSNKTKFYEYPPLLNNKNEREKFEVYYLELGTPVVQVSPVQVSPEQPLPAEGGKRKGRKGRKGRKTYKKNKKTYKKGKKCKTRRRN